QRLPEAGSDDRAVGLFADHRLAGQRARFGLDLMPGLSWPVVRAGLARIVPYVVIRQPPAPPLVQQAADSRLRLRMIARAMPSPSRVIDGLLHIDNHQRRTCRSIS